MARILIVDDSHDIRLLLVAMLQRAGHEVVEAADGATVQSWVSDCNPDLIILDLMMPGMDGWDALARLKASPASRNIPVIIFSALNTDEDLDKARSMGAIDYISKPWTESDLLDRIRWATTIESKSA
ncbi:MAG: response regulator [Chloroflexi bacterium]|nr:response regulator [Chloroflexota bacterium]